MISIQNVYFSQHFYRMCSRPRLKSVPIVKKYLIIDLHKQVGKQGFFKTKKQNIQIDMIKNSGIDKITKKERNIDIKIIQHIFSCKTLQILRKISCILTEVFCGKSMIIFSIGRQSSIKIVWRISVTSIFFDIFGGMIA